MPIPSLPPQGDTSWYGYAQGLDAAARASTTAANGWYNLLDGPYTVDRTGVMDSSTAIQSAMNAAASTTWYSQPSVYVGDSATMPIGRTFYIPDGNYKLNTGLVKPQGLNVICDPGAVLRAGASMTTMLDTSPTLLAQNESITGGTWDCNGLAGTGIFARRFAQLKLTDLHIESPTVSGLTLGDPAAPTVSYNAAVIRLTVGRAASSSVPTGSYGLWVRNATDNELQDGNIYGADIGVRLEVLGGSTTFTHYHAWGYPSRVPSICFDDNSYGTTWIGCYADSPSSIGFKLGHDSQMIGCRGYKNTSSPDNEGTFVYINDAAGLVSVLGAYIIGADPSHRWAKDIDGPGAAVATWAGLRTRNVTTMYGAENQITATSTNPILSLQNVTGSSEFFDWRFTGGSYAGAIKPNGELMLSGAGLGVPLRTLTAGATLTKSDMIVLLNAGTTQTVVMPGAADSNIETGRRFIFRNIGTASWTIDAATGNVDGAATQTLAAGAKATYVTDGTNYYSV